MGRLPGPPPDAALSSLFLTSNLASCRGVEMVAAQRSPRRSFDRSQRLLSQSYADASRRTTVNRRRTVQRQIGTASAIGTKRNHRFAAIGDGVRLAAFNGMQNLRCDYAGHDDDGR